MQRSAGGGAKRCWAYMVATLRWFTASPVYRLSCASCIGAWRVKKLSRCGCLWRVCRGMLGRVFARPWWARAARGWGVVFAEWWRGSRARVEAGPFGSGESGGEERGGEGKGSGGTERRRGGTGSHCGSVAGGAGDASCRGFTHSPVGEGRP